MGEFQDQLRQYCPAAKESGKELKEIAIELTSFLGEEVTVDQVRWALKSAGYQTPIQRLDNHGRLIEEKCDKGWSDSRIGKLLGFTKDQVCAWRRKYGIRKPFVKRPSRSPAIRKGRQRYWAGRSMEAAATGWPHVPHPGKALLLEGCWKAADENNFFHINDALAEAGVKHPSKAFWYLRDQGLIECVRGRRGVWRLLAERETLQEFENKLRLNFPDAGAAVAEAVSTSLGQDFTGVDAVLNRWRWAVARLKSKAGMTERTFGVYVAGDTDYNFSDDGSVI